MSLVHLEVTCPVHDSFRVQQVAGMFDVPLQERSTASFSVDVPDASEDWQIGLITGPSGSGKSSIARHVFAGALYDETAWPLDRAVIDGFGELSTREITGLLTSVGFGSPPAWIRPFHVLSRGEQFRCHLARAIAGAMTQALTRAKQAASPCEQTPLVVFDEFTSVVDRTVAKIGSAAIARSIRAGHTPCRFVAVTCHYDVAEWLEPDWVVDMQTGACQRRRLRRPALELTLARCHRRLWRAFAPHHYLSGSLSAAARCYAAFWEDQPVSFCATLPVIGKRNHWRITRLVTLPDFQGVGIGVRVAEAVCDLHRAAGCRINVTASHPALVAHCARSARWRTVRVLRSGAATARRFIAGYRSSAGRSVVSFEYLGNRT